jgi:hypothetical protein
MGTGNRRGGNLEWFLPHPVGQWLLSLRDFLADSEFTLEIVNTYTVHLRRIHDRILMDDVMAGFSSDSEIQGIDRCRLCLQVECLSDISTADGARLDPGLQKKPPTVTSTSRIQWPCQGLPGPRAWATWRRFLKTYTRDSVSHQLRQTMGQWTQPNLRTWNTYYDTASQMLCQHVPTPATATTGTKDSWHYHPAQITHTRRFLAVTKSNTLQTHILKPMRFRAHFFERRKHYFGAHCHPL